MKLPYESTCPPEALRSNGRARLHEEARFVLDVGRQRRGCTLAAQPLFYTTIIACTGTGPGSVIYS